MESSYTFKAWEDIDIFPTVSEDTEYRIDLVGDTDTDTPIYSCTVLNGYKLERINEIISKYPQIIFPGFSSFIGWQEGSATFKVYKIDSSNTASLVTTITILYDWSYDNNTNPILSNPVNNILDYRQFLLFSTKYDTDHTINIKWEHEDTLVNSYTSYANFYTYYIKRLSEFTYPGEFTFAYSDDFFIIDNIPGGVGNILVIDGKRYLIANTCKNYCLYYINSRGGFDSMLIQGKQIQNDKITNYNYKKNYLYNVGLTNTDRGIVNYKKDIVEGWQLNTHKLTDAQSEKISELFKSNEVYLHNLDTDQITPVIITNTNVEYKTFRNQERKWPIYTINVQSSQTKFRF